MHLTVDTHQDLSVSQRLIEIFLLGTQSQKCGLFAETVLPRVGDPRRYLISGIPRYG